MHLNSLNIRKGLELEEVEVVDIFKPHKQPIGNPEAEMIHKIGWSTYVKKHKNNPTIEQVKEEGGIIYFTEKTEYVVTNNMKAYVYDCYMIFADEENENTISSSFNTEIQFISDKTLNFNEFCTNTMEAQAFCGNYEFTGIKYSFVGHGDFTIQDYSGTHNMIIFSRIHMLDFYILYKNVLSSIGYFVSGLFEEDILQQKEYLTDKEYKSLMRECKKQKKIVIENFNNSRKDSENDDLDDYED